MVFSGAQTVREIAMDQDQFECFAIPSHVFAEDEVRLPLPPAETTPRNWVRREMAFLGMEALPSALFDADAPALGR
jgi:hypothetical protein